MGEFDDHVAVMGDSMPISPSLRAFLSSISSNDVRARPVMDPDSENQSKPPFRVAEGHCPSGNADQNYQTQVSVGSDETSNTNALAEPKLSSCGGLVERIAARAGFDPSRLKLNTESIRPPADISEKPEVYCAHLTIPSGLSPTTLLESPVFLSNSQVMPSPTTGKLSLGPSENNWNSTLVMGDPDRAKENASEAVDAPPFAFKPHSISSPYISQSFGSFGVSVSSDTACRPQSIEPPKVHSENNGALFEQGNLSESHGENNGSNSFLLEQAYNSSGDAENSPPFDELHEDAGQGFNGDPNAGGSPADDGFNWRKYGQKHVKGSEYPRSYYKCTHPSCPVKKKVERSHEGHITEIIYRGAHSHPKPPPNRRSALGSLNALGGILPDSEQRETSADGDLIWSVRQEGNVVGAPGWKRDNLLAAPLGQQNSNGATATLQAPSGGQYESRDGADRSSIFTNNGDDDDRATHGSVSLGYDGEGDELESKRRRIEHYGLEMTARAIREPRVVVQTTSEVDILDDGYRWRKYGQKVVKGNPNPRSYYKCTSHGCNVRKHVERASHDVMSVVTTYEGKHNHDVPAAKNSGHMNSGSSNVLASRRVPVAVSSVHIHGHEPSQVCGLTLPSLGLQGPGFAFGMNQPGLAGLGLAGSGLNQGRSPFMPVHSYSRHLLRPVNDMSYMVRKGEQSWIL